MQQCIKNKLSKDINGCKIALNKTSDVSRMIKKSNQWHDQLCTFHTEYHTSNREKNFINVTDDMIDHIYFMQNHMSKREQSST